MNSKAIRKQLLAAVAMVLVAAVALGSSTYAWFVASGTVEAKGMKVTAQSDAGLAIRYGSSGLWGSVATASMETAKALYPVSTADVKNWYHATAKVENSYQAIPESRNDVTTDILGDSRDAYTDNSYVVMKTFEIRSTSAGALSKGLYVSDIQATVDGNNHIMNTALRVAVEYVDGDGNSNVRFFAPITYDSTNKPRDNYDVWKYVPKAGDTPAKEQSVGKVHLATYGDKNPIVTEDQATESKPAHLTNAVIIGDNVEIPYSKTTTEGSTAAGVLVNIYIWFEGEDTNLTTAQFATDDISISVKFTSDPVAPANPG